MGQAERADAFPSATHGLLNGDVGEVLGLADASEIGARGVHRDELDVARRQDAVRRIDPRRSV